MRIQILDTGLEEKYENYILKKATNLFYASNKYRNLLKEFLRADDYYFIALDSNENIAGVLPSFLKSSGYGNVLNSLPFYGSNGGVICNDGDYKLTSLLLNEYYDFAKHNNVISATVITSPFEDNIEYYDNHLDYTYKDTRIGQFTKLPMDDSNIENDLFDVFHYKTRNSIRKAQKLNVLITSEYSRLYFDFLVSTHKDNMNEIGGISKPYDFFKIISSIYEYGKDYMLYTALHEGNPIASLLIFKFNKTIEYFTPVIKKEYRSYNALNLLIFEAMKDSVKQGFDWWNWGGTWLTQDGVYNFKKRWGTSEKNYYYYTKVFNNSLLSMTKDVLLDQYPYFYVIPFGRLCNNELTDNPKTTF